MQSTINTGGFDVGVVPHYTPPDLDTLARFNPALTQGGALGSIQVAQQAGKLAQQLQTQPSETAASIASNQLEAQQKGPQGLQSLGGIGSFLAQQGKLPVDTSVENSIDPETGVVTKTTTNKIAGLDKPLSTISEIDKTPRIYQTGTINPTAEGVEVNTPSYMAKDPSKPALTLNKTTGLWEPSDNAILVDNKFAFQKNLVGRGAQANTQQMGVFADLMNKATDPASKAFYAEAIQDLKNGNEADADRNAALAVKAKADAEKAGGANDTSLKKEGMKDTTAKEIAGQKSASNEKISEGKNQTALSVAHEKSFDQWNAGEAKNAFEEMGQHLKNSGNANLSPEERSAESVIAGERYKQLQKWQAIQDQQGAQAATSTVNSGSQPGQSQLPKVDPSYAGKTLVGPGGISYTVGQDGALTPIK